MIPQKLVPELLPEEQASSPVEEKQTRTSVKNRLAIKILLRFLVGVMSFAVGIRIPLLSLVGGNSWFSTVGTDNSWVAWGFVLAIVAGLVGGLLSVSFWSLLLVSAPMFDGLILGFDQVYGIEEAALSSIPSGTIGISLSTIILTPAFAGTALISAALGTVISLALEPLLMERFSRTRKLRLH